MNKKKNQRFDNLRTQGKKTSIFDYQKNKLELLNYVYSGEITSRLKKLEPKAADFKAGAKFFVSVSQQDSLIEITLVKFVIIRN